MAMTVLGVFAVVYLGMMLGGLPFLQLDRTGVALLGAIALVALGALSPLEAAQAVHLPTLLLLFSFMVISAQMRLGGFYTRVTLGLADLRISPPALLAAVIVVVGTLSAIFSNDIICLAVAPVLADACLERRLDPVPYLLGLACAANVGSAATLIGNPQNMLVGQVLELSFAGYFLEAIAPVLLGLAATWGILVWQTRGRWRTVFDDPPPERRNDYAIYNRWQTAKGLCVALAVLGAFLLTDVPREVAALAGAGLLLMSRRFHSHKMLGLVDWELLVLFIGLFVVNRALAQTGLVATAMDQLLNSGVPLSDTGPLFVATLLLSSVVSNVPAVMLLLPAASEAFAGPMLALVSTLAGNLLIVGSIANIIVVDAARRRGIAIDWRTHARTGVPVALVTLLVTAVWFALRH
ncbi:MAG: anion transporter [Betaproteobacteria bacterium]|nr:anion transporter [Betaproteobacteria bacterium]